MTLAQLRYLVAIVDAGLNITLAAERVHATQPGISKQLRQLESELGFQMFKRRGKSLDAVTAEGASVVQHARAILAEAQSIRALSTTLKQDNGGSLTLVTSHTQARFVLPPVMARLRETAPNLILRVIPTSHDDALAQIEQGTADVAVISTTEDRPPTQLALPLYRWQRVAIVPRDHELIDGMPLTLKRLAQFPLVSYDSTLKPESSLRRSLLALGLTPRVALTAQDADLIKTYVRQGLGVGIIGEMALRDEDTDLVVLPLNDLLDPCITWLLPRSDRALSAPIDVLVRTLAPHLDAVALRQWLAGDRTAPVQPEKIPDWPLAQLLPK